MDFLQQRVAMVKSQIEPCDVLSKDILGAFEDLPREKFIPRQLKRIAYMDDEFPLPHKRYMLRPQVLARMLAAAAPLASDKVLYIGCSLGYGPAILSSLVAEVIGLEGHTDLSQKAEENIKDVGAKNVEIVNGPLREGWAESAPYTLILIEGMIAYLPDVLEAQLADGGRIVAIKQHPSQRSEVVKIEKNQCVLTEIPVFDARAPLLEGFSLPQEFVFTK